MRIDQHLQPAALGLNARQHVFVSAWFNLVHQHSLDSYRVRVMNPANILGELRKMFDPPGDDGDRKVVAEEALEILQGHPVLEAKQDHYPAKTDALELIRDAVQHKENGFKKNALLVKSFLREFDVSLRQFFLRDCFEWIEETVASVPAAESTQERDKVYGQIRLVCRDILSIAHQEGFSLESLFHLYRHLADGEKVSAASQKTPDDGSDGIDDIPVTSTVAAYVFSERLERVKTEITAAPKEHHVVFTITGASTAQIGNICGTFGRIRFSEEGPNLTGTVRGLVSKQYSKAHARLFAYAQVESRDGRSAGLDAYREIGQVLDLMRFEYDTEHVSLATKFLLIAGEEYHVIKLPQLIPNPEAEPPTKSLQEFVEHLGSLAARDNSQTESKDRIFSAFRLYRTGTNANMFENKLVQWWTAIEYLTSGARSSGGIGETVKANLASTLTLTYISKHMAAFRSALADFDAEIVIGGVSSKARDWSNQDIYKVLKDPANGPALEAACAGQPYLWKHLSEFIENLSAPSKIANLLKAHDQRVRWQIERIYRARCDIVHAGGQVAMASLLCANLEFYLRMTLKAMLKTFANVSTLTGPAEFFERQRHQLSRVLLALEPQDKKITATDAPLVATLG